MFSFSFKKQKFITSIVLFIFATLLFAACAPKSEEKPQPSVSETRYCSFTISNLNETFSTDQIKLNVRYGINVKNNSANQKAAFLIYNGNEAAPTVLQNFEDLATSDYTFTESDGNYIYKKETVLHLNGSFFDKTEDEFFIGLYLFDKNDDSFENPVVGYSYKLKYSVNENQISFEKESEFIVRHH